MQTQLTKEQIIIETILAYQNPKSRAYWDGTCYYLHQPTGNTCAVGRCMNELANKRYIGSVRSYMIEVFSISSGELEIYDKGIVFDQHLQPQYRGHNLQFWIDLQMLHDGVDNWIVTTDKTTLSPDGWNFVNWHLCSKFALNFKTISDEYSQTKL